jgi:hypothetical protein
VPKNDRKRLDPRVALSGALFDSPGVYAVFAGSGLSSNAGIKTGYQVVEELVRRVAASEGVDLDATGTDPAEWWEENGFGELKYAPLIESLARTPAAQRALLRRFFEPGLDLPVAPTAAHRALAQLVADGRVRVIATTNFDPLIERAIEAVGLSPQVVSSASEVRGMTPLCHADITAIKVNGDYASPKLKNSPAELLKVEPAMRRLLDQVFDEYGLVIVGWAATHDPGICDVLARRAGRRYPFYWAKYHDSVTEEARRLISQNKAIEIETAGADDFIPDLVDRVTNLERRVTRQSAPRRVRMHTFLPNTSVPMQGWAEMPLLILRAGARMMLGSDEIAENLAYAQRQACLAALTDSPVTQLLRELAASPGMGAISARASKEELSSIRPEYWFLVGPPDVEQTSDHAVLRLGGDASSGVAAIVDIKCPPQFTSGGAVEVVLEMGFSVGGKLWVDSVAALLRYGAVLVTTDLPAAIVDILPVDASFERIELHALAGPMTKDNTHRENSLPERIDFDPFKSFDFASPSGFPQMGYGEEIASGLARAEAAELVLRAMNQMALNHGYINPEPGLDRIRKAFEVFDKQYG